MIAPQKIWGNVAAVRRPQKPQKFWGQQPRSWFSSTTTSPPGGGERVGDRPRRRSPAMISHRAASRCWSTLEPLDHPEEVASIPRRVLPEHLVAVGLVEALGVDDRANGEPVSPVRARNHHPRGPRVGFRCRPVRPRSHMHVSQACAPPCDASDLPAEQRHGSWKAKPAAVDAGQEAVDSSDVVRHRRFGRRVGRRAVLRRTTSPPPISTARHRFARQTVSHLRRRATTAAGTATKDPSPVSPSSRRRRALGRASSVGPAVGRHSTSRRSERPW